MNCRIENETLLNKTVTYEIYDISNEAPEAIEQMGTKEKFWLTWRGQQWLFKYNRKDYGEDWAEKIAGEFAHILQIPSARSELAVFNGKHGVLVESFTHQKADGQGRPIKCAELVHGNDLISLLIDPDYPKELLMKNQEHTLDRIEKVLNKFSVVPSQHDYSALTSEFQNAFDIFLGYLLLDALVSNTDRHHENWGIRAWMSINELTHLAPSFDHASSLGRNESEAKKQERLNTKDLNYRPEAYAMKAPSRIYLNNDDAQPFTAIGAFDAAFKKRPDSGRFWLNRLGSVDMGMLEAIISQVPGQRMTTCSKDFSISMIHATRERLLGSL